MAETQAPLQTPVKKPAMPGTPLRPAPSPVPSLKSAMQAPAVPTPLTQVLSTPAPLTPTLAQAPPQGALPIQPQAPLRAPGSAEEFPEFFVDLRPKNIKLPELGERRTLNIRYPLMPPYANAHIFWDNEASELIYDVEEVQLTEIEAELLGLIKLGLEEMINISFSEVKKENLIMKYLERNVQTILLELGAKVSAESYKKILYYIYRDFVGLNEIEPLLNDFFIEDIECNGINSPVYIVHRKYENLRTNIIYKEPRQLVDFIEKLAQKTGRYVSFAKPLLDGTLPDGSRVNATYTSDVTTHGPTFTIRKFTPDPLTPINLIEYGTSTPEVFAYLWLAIEHKNNVMIIGETASGKTTFLNSILQFVPSEARIVSIEDTRELNLAHSNWVPAVTRSGFGIPNLVGRQYGEVSLFDLLKETFRQNPDYVVVGEVRGKETYVLFQGMASGHSSFSTFHAASIETLVRRLETRPISLPASLVESLNIICSLLHIKDQRKNVRRLRALEEVIRVRQKVGEVESNTVFEWDPINDSMLRHGKSVVLEKASKMTGVPIQSFEKELLLRASLLRKMHEQNISNYKEFTQIVNEYYKNKQAVLKRFGITGAEASVKGQSELKKAEPIATQKKPTPVKPQKHGVKKQGKKRQQKKQSKQIEQRKQSKQGMQKKQGKQRIVKMATTKRVGKPKR